MEASKGIAYTKTIKRDGKEYRLALMEVDGEHYLETQCRWDPDNLLIYDRLGAWIGSSPEWQWRPGSGIHTMEQLLIDQLLAATPEYEPTTQA